MRFRKAEFGGVATAGALLLFVSGCWYGAQAGKSQTANVKSAPGDIKPKVELNTMAGRKIPAAKIGLPTGGAVITSAAVMPGTGRDVPAPDFVPEFCNIEGQIAPVDPTAPLILFRVNIPTNWNQKAFHIGGNGMDGFIPNISKIVRDKPGSPLGPAYPPDLQFPIAQGYATYGSNSGHGEPNAPTPDQGRGGQGRGQAGAAGNQATPQGPPPANDNSWMLNQESLKNFAYEQIKKTHDVAMEILVEMYGTKPRVNYFAGESQGGREALMAVAHYPDDYNGVLASVPLAFFTGVLVSPTYRLKAQVPAGAWVPPAKAPTLAAEVLRQCDGLDGLADGVINNYYQCDRLLDPTITPDPLARIRCAGGADTGNDCLSDTQIATINAFHAPMKWGFPVANGEAAWPGEPAGSEGAMGYLLAGARPDPNRPPAGPGGNMVGVMLGDPVKYNLLTIDFTDAKEQLQSLSKLIDAPTDWKKFQARGGKLILHSAGNDYVTNARGHALVYEQAVQRQGQATVDRFARFYVTPNANHGSVGFSATTKEPQARFMDLLTPLQDWVEKGVAPPDVIPQKLMDDKPPYTVIRSRPLCRYPKYPRYNGTGDANKMESYSCAAP